MSSDPSSSPLANLAIVLQELQQTSAPARDEGGVLSPSSSESSPFVQVGSSDSRAADTQLLLPDSASHQGESKLEHNLTSYLPSAVVAASTTHKRYKLWVTPDPVKGVCLSIVRQGSTFCISKKCTVNHKSQKEFVPNAGDIFVMRTATTAFIAPSINVSVLESELLSKWLNQTCTIEEWHQRFMLVQQEVEDPILRLPSEKISELDIMAKQEMISSSLAFKTPRKKRSVTMSLLEDDISDFHQLALDFNKSANIYDALNERFTLVTSVLESFHSKQTEAMALLLKGVESAVQKTTKLKNSIGSQPENLDVIYHSPNLWLSLALIADQVSQVNASLLSKEEVLSLISQHHIDQGQSRSIDFRLQGFSDQIRKLNIFTVDAVKVLNNKILNQPTSWSDNTFADDLKGSEDRIWSKLNKMDSELASYRSANDETASIKFGQLGCRNLKEFSAWMEDNHPGEEYGYLVDFHLVMEHIHIQISGQKLMSNLEKVYKMQLRSNNQAIAISSFESRMPRFFCNDHKNFVRKDESYFTSIKSWNDWDLPNDGFRDRLKQELHLFKTGHQFLIDTELESLSPFHTLCNLALTESVSWVEGITRYVDDTYNEYARSRYGSARAWHITTRLARSLVDKVAAPRNSVHNAFKINKPMEVSKSIAYSSLRSLDNMTQITSYNFKNSPIVTSELSKFLALNSNFEVVEKLNAKVTQLENENANLKKDVKAASAAAHTASNKFDSTFKSSIEDLKRRLKSLESKA